MKEQNPNPNQSEADREIATVLSRLEYFQTLMKEAIQYGYDIEITSSLDFSPVDILLEVVIDILLLIRSYYKEGTKSQTPNQGLGFSDRYQDVLGNPKQFRINFPSKYYWDPQASDYFWKLASLFVDIKEQKPLQKAFMTFCENFSVSPSPKKTRSKKQTKNFYYWRRQKSRLARFRRKNHKTQP